MRAAASHCECTSYLTTCFCRVACSRFFLQPEYSDVSATAEFLQYLFLAMCGVQVAAAVITEPHENSFLYTTSSILFATLSYIVCALLFREIFFATVSSQLEQGMAVFAVASHALVGVLYRDLHSFPSTTLQYYACWPTFAVICQI